MRACLAGAHSWQGLAVPSPPAGPPPASLQHPCPPVSLGLPRGQAGHGARGAPHRDASHSLLACFSVSKGELRAC